MSSSLEYGLTGLLVALDQAPVILGTVIFEGHEVPSRISIGGAQAVRIHRLPGGGRVIDAMGVDDGAIGWNGFFTGPLAAARARLVDTMRQNGQLVGLSFGDYAFNVIVVHFEYDLQDRGALISYRIRTEIMPDAGLETDNAAGAVANALSLDVGTATNSLAAFGLTVAQAALARVDVALSLPGEPNSAIKLAALYAALQASGSAVQNEIMTSTGSLAGSGMAESVTVTSAVALTAALAAAGSLAGSLQAASYVNRSDNWLSQLAGQPQGAPLIFA